MQKQASVKKNKRRLPNRHDHFVRRALKDMELARGFFELFLPPKYQEVINLEDLEFKSESHIDESLDEVVLDGLFQAPYKDGHYVISILTEHKSGGTTRASAQNLPLQVVHQELAVIEDYRRSHPKHRYPIVVPLAIYHGQRAYSGPETIADHMIGPETLVPERWSVPNMYLIDLSQYSDEELALGGKLGVFLLILKYIYRDNVLEILESLLPEMQGIDINKDGSGFLVSMFNYLYECLEPKSQSKCLEIALQLSKETGGKVMTIADALRKEGEKNGKIIGKKIGEKIGEKRGEKRGKIAGKEETAINMIKDGVDPKLIARYAKLSLKRVEELSLKLSS